MSVRVRFAPAPTGSLHLGGGRTALFNWLFARKKGGSLILRVEDTDRSRSTLRAEQAILEDLTWLGLRWDEGPFRQTERVKSGIYGRYLALLRQKGAAYERQGALYYKVHNPHCKSDVVTFTDLVHGTLSAPATFEDFVIQKSDGTPTFIFANLVDDYEMAISHVIRGDEHISNTFRQLLMAPLLGFDPGTITYAHLPLILAADRAKLAKRHGAKAIGEFRAEGYLPEALTNYAALLGFSPQAFGYEQETYSLKELVELFDFGGVQSSPAIFDAAKLLSINAAWIRRLKPSDFAKRLETFAERPYTSRIATLVQTRSETLAQASEMTTFFFEEPKVKVTTKQEKEILKAAIETLSRVGEWQAGRLEEVMRAKASALGLQAGAFFMPIRRALTGRTVAPPLFEAIEIVGRRRTLQRLRRAAA